MVARNYDVSEEPDNRLIKRITNHLRDLRKLLSSEVLKFSQTDLDVKASEKEVHTGRKKSATFPFQPFSQQFVQCHIHLPIQRAQKESWKRRGGTYKREVRGKQEIECQGALFAPDGGLRVSLKGKERQRKRETGRNDNTT